MNSQTLPRLHSLVRITVSAIALTLPLTFHTNAAAETWFEDFTDGSFTDDPELGLRFLRSHELRPDGLLVETPVSSGPAATLAMGLNRSDGWSIRTQGRLLQDHGFFGPTVAPGLSGSGSFWSYISSAGLAMGSFVGGNESTSGSAGLLDPTAEDIVIQLDVFAGTAKLWAWTAEDPPVEEFPPMLERDFNLPTGFPGVWVRSNIGESGVVLRNVTVSTEHISIPGPGLRDPVLGDCNRDGSVDAFDLTCVADVLSRDAVLDELNSLPGDLDGDGNVAFEDFLVLSANFGQNVGYADGNVDLDGSVDFADFLVLSANFGQSAEAVATVPEPTGCGLIATVLLGCGMLRRRTKIAPGNGLSNCSASAWCQNIPPNRNCVAGRGLCDDLS